MEKSVELGVKSITPFVSDFSYIKSKNRVSESKVKRWATIAKSACQQSGRGHALDLKGVLSLPEALSEAASPDSLNLFAYEKAQSLSLKSYIATHRLREKENVNIFVGSEGGFSQKESDLFSSFKIQPISLGQQILRVETACVALISSIKYELS